MLPSSPPSFQPDASGELPGANRALVPLLKVARSELNAQGAYLYSVDLRNAIATLMVWSGLPPADSRLDRPARRRDPVALLAKCARRLSPACLEERGFRRAAGISAESVRRRGFYSAARFRSGDRAVQCLQSEPLALKPPEFSSLLNLSFPIAALLSATAARDTLEREIEKLDATTCGPKAVRPTKA